MNGLNTFDVPCSFEFSVTVRPGIITGSTIYTCNVFESGHYIEVLPNRYGFDLYMVNDNDNKNQLGSYPNKSVADEAAIYRLFLAARNKSLELSQSIAVYSVK